MNKRGQFFLIAAVVIVGIIITLSTINISTKTSKNNNAAFYDLSKQINYESSRLIDYGVLNGRTFSQTSSSLVSFVSNYSIANPDTDMLLIYGNISSLTILVYSQTSSGNVNIGGAGLHQTFIAPQVPKYTVTGNNIAVQLSQNSTLNFELNPGENFFIVLKKQSGDETLVAQ